MITGNWSKAREGLEQWGGAGREGRGSGTGATPRRRRLVCCTLVQSRMGAGFGRAVAARMLLVVLVLSTSGHFTTSLPPNEGRATETGHVGSEFPRRSFAQCFTQSTSIMPRLLLRPGTSGTREKWNSCTNALYKAAPVRSQGSRLRPLHGLTRPQAEQRRKTDAKVSSGDVGGEEGKRKWLNWPIFSNVHDREIIAMAIPSYTAVRFMTVCFLRWCTRALEKDRSGE